MSTVTLSHVNIQAMLKWYKLPSRGGNGGTEWSVTTLQEVWDIRNDGTEWYYVSLKEVKQIWQEATDYALGIADDKVLKFNKIWYDEDEPHPTRPRVPGMGPSLLSLYQLGLHPEFLVSFCFPR